MKHKLVISAGSGPEPARHFVRLLAEQLELLCHRLGLGMIREGDSLEMAFPRSAEYWVDGPERMLAALRAECGTHVLLQGPTHPAKAGRTRWFASVSLVTAPEPFASVLDRSQVEIRAMRSQGPGGQNVNKRSTAVRLRHLPTGIELRAQEQRSQAANRRVALERLQYQLEFQGKMQRESAARREWNARHSVQRSTPVRQYRLGPKGTLEIDG